MSKQIWNIDGAHSEIGFKVRHMMITNVNGVFNEYTGTMAADATDFSDAEISFEANIDSVNTRNEQRDGHLKGEECQTYDLGDHNLNELFQFCC
jgi:polyisoprenoid-binding protein YceI